MGTDTTPASAAVGFKAVATFDNAQLLEICGPRNPDAEAPRGVVEKGAHAYLLLIAGNPVKDREGLFWSCLNGFALGRYSV